MQEFSQNQDVIASTEMAQSLGMHPWKVAFRNSVQDFIKGRTKDGVYAGYMDDMSNLFRLRDTVLVKATKERSLNALQAWLKANPTLVKTAGWATLISGGYLAGKTGIGSSTD